MKPNTFPGKFIVFDGLDGSGQSTQVALLSDFLITKGLKVVKSKEPTLLSEAGKKIRKVLDKEIQMAGNTLQELFSQDRKEHLDNLVIPALQAGEVVILDRYFFSTFAYGMADGLDLDWLIKLNEEFLIPDLTFFLKVAPEVCIKRIEERGTKKTLFEKTERLAKVWGKYMTLPDIIENINILDGEKTIAEVFDQVVDIVVPRLGLE